MDFQRKILEVALHTLNEAGLIHESYTGIPES